MQPYWPLRACVSAGSGSRSSPPRDASYQPGGIHLDFSAIAKGYGVDAVLRYLLQAGVEHALVEVGGELRGQGMKPDGQPWWVMLENPPGGGDGARRTAGNAGRAAWSVGGHLG